uniref:Uncharacterized protein n=1 Tax=viral metagenome TaxID=1070528 RepID=A0A6M3X665_9ZZZZ
MNKETYEALKTIIIYLDVRGIKKDLGDYETITQAKQQLQDWIDEVAKEYIEEDL